MSVCIDVIIKFGGTAITDKNIMETLFRENLQAAVKCVKDVLESGFSCAIVHGAGSFGHHHAKQYEINKGFPPEPNVDGQKKHTIWGCALTRQSVTKLNKLVVDSLLEAGVPAIGCSAGSSWITKDGQPVQWPSEVLAGLLTNGLVPVIHGDVCVDQTKGCCILSGDTIIKILCNQFVVKRAVFLTDVAGVFDRPPQEPGACLLRRVYVRKDGSLASTIHTSQPLFDVTGGITLKLNTACAIITQSDGVCPVVICSVKSPAILQACVGDLDSEKLECTVVTLQSLT